MFGKKKKTARPNKVNSLVGPQTEITGNINFSGGLHVEGTVTGNVFADIDADAILILSETGLIKGEVRAPFLVINGTVEGDVHATERLELTAGARVQGNVYYNLIEMAIGAEVNGSLIHYAGGDQEVSSRRAMSEPGQVPQKSLVDHREPVVVSKPETGTHGGGKSGPFGFGH